MQAVTAAVQAKRSTEDAERRAAREVGRAKRERARRRGRVHRRPARAQGAVEGQRRADAGPAGRVEGVAAQRSQARPRVRGRAVEAVQRARNGFDRHRRAALRPARGQPSPRPRPPSRSWSARPRRWRPRTDWAPTAAAFKRLMDRWRDAGRASRNDDDALWARFRAAQDSFFAARTRSSRPRTRSTRPTSWSRRSCWPRPRRCCRSPTSTAAKASLREIQDALGGRRQGAAQRHRADREGRMRRVEQAVRDAEEKRWKRTEPRGRGPRAERWSTSSRPPSRACAPTSTRAAGHRQRPQDRRGPRGPRGPRAVARPGPGRPGGVQRLTGRAPAQRLGSAGSGQTGSGLVALPPVIR